MPASNSVPDSKGLPDSFAEAVREAQMLLRYASLKGLRVDDPHLTAVAEAADAIGKKSVTVEIQRSFWSALSTLAQVVAPVTVESIHATMDNAPATESILWLRLRNRPYSLARWCSFKFRATGIFFLLLVILIQVFWVVGSYLLQDTLEIERQLESITKKREATGADPNLTALQTELEIWMIGNYQSLKQWNRMWARIAVGVKPPFESEEFEKLKPPAQNRIELISVALILQALSNYVLPLLYGLLGACAFVLRELTKEIRNVTFSPGSNIRYGLRLTLGLLAGIAVGLLFASDSTQVQSNMIQLFPFEPNSISDPASGATQVEPLSLKALSPLALAFMAGYSVELVFAAMDRIIDAFTGESQRGIG